MSVASYNMLESTHNFEKKKENSLYYFSNVLIKSAATSILVLGILKFMHKNTKSSQHYHVLL